jgi:hypothetical protein
VRAPTKRTVFLVAQMFKDERGPGYLLNEIVSVFGNQPSAEEEAAKLARIGGTYSVFEHEVRHSILM